MPHLSAADETNLVDVIIVGGGQGGLAIAGTLIKECVTNILVIDKQPLGAGGYLEKPWSNADNSITRALPWTLYGCSKPNL
jgi:cation diffusion facilitator CzcD-associated flavoprotein CzcO